MVFIWDYHTWREICPKYSKLWYFLRVKTTQVFKTRIVGADWLGKWIVTTVNHGLYHGFSFHFSSFCVKIHFELGRGFQYTSAVWREFLAFGEPEHRPSCSAVPWGILQIQIRFVRQRGNRGKPRFPLLSHVHLNLDLGSLHLIQLLWFFSKNVKKITSVSLIQSL